MAASFSLSLHEAFRWRWNKLASNVEIVLSADEAVRNQMKFWNDNHTLMYFNMVCSYRGYYCGLSIHLREFDSPTDRQIIRE